MQLSAWKVAFTVLSLHLYRNAIQGVTTRDRSECHSRSGFSARAPPKPPVQQNEVERMLPANGAGKPAHSMECESSLSPSSNVVDLTNYIPCQSHPLSGLWGAYACAPWIFPAMRKRSCRRLAGTLAPPSGNRVRTALGNAPDRNRPLPRDSPEFSNTDSTSFGFLIVFLGSENRSAKRQLGDSG